MAEIVGKVANIVKQPFEACDRPGSRYESERSEAHDTVRLIDSCLFSGWRPSEIHWPESMGRPEVVKNGMYDVVVQSGCTRGPSSCDFLIQRCQPLVRGAYLCSEPVPLGFPF